MSSADAPAGLRFWFPKLPAERLGMLRVLVGFYSLVYFTARLPYWLSCAERRPEQFDPVGPLAWMDAPLDPWLFRALVFLAALGAVPFLLGFRYRLLGPAFALLLGVVLTYANSWGTVLHTENLWLVHVVVLSLAPAADAVSLDARRVGRVPPPHFRYGWAIRLMCWVAVCAYFVAGVAKVKNAGWVFLEGESLRNYVALDNVRKLELGSPYYSPLAIVLLEHTRVFGVLAAMSLCLELGAPIAMLRPAIGKVWSVMMWSFHAGVLALMAIGFFYPLTFIAYTPFFRVERLLRFVRRGSAEASTLASASELAG